MTTSLDKWKKSNPCWGKISSWKLPGRMVNWYRPVLSTNTLCYMQRQSLAMIPQGGGRCILMTPWFIMNDQITLENTCNALLEIPTRKNWLKLYHQLQVIPGIWIVTLWETNQYEFYRWINNQAKHMVAFLPEKVPIDQRLPWSNWCEQVIKTVPRRKLICAYLFITLCVLPC